MSTQQNPSNITVDYRQLWEGLEEGLGPNGGWVKKDYLVAWKDRFTFVNQVIGVGTINGGTSGAWIQNLPFRYPESPNLFAYQCTIVPYEETFHVDSSSPPSSIPAITYDWAKVTVLFKNPEWSFTQDEDPQNLNTFGTTAAEQQALLWATQEIDYSHEYYTIPKSTLFWYTGGSVVNTPMPKRVTVHQMSIVYERFPYLPMGWLAKYVDTVNNATFLGNPKGSVLFAGAKTRREFNTDGTICQKLAINFKYRTGTDNNGNAINLDWNKFPKDTATWDFVTNNVGFQNFMFPYMNFQNLIQFS